MDYVFMTDSNSDIPYFIVDKYQIPVVYMPYTLDGVEHFADLGRDPSVGKDFYDKMRAGSTPITSLLPTPVYLDYFEPILKESDLLFIAFSSQLSNTILNVYEAREELLAKYPGRKFVIVDTMSISATQTLLILRAYEMYLAGKPMEEIAEWVDQNKFRAHAVLTVDDLKYLKRGGRISGTAAAFGTMLDLRPILAIGKNGKIVPTEKVQGRKKALRTLADRTAELIENPEEQTLIIIHADSQEDAARLEKLIREKVPAIRDIMIIPVGPVIGTHCGPGTLASCFMGKERPV